MSDDPIRNQIEGLGYRRLAGCAGKFVLVVLSCAFVIGLFAKHTSKGVSLCVLWLASGLALGFATSILTPIARRILLTSFVFLGVVPFLWMFIMRTTLGASRELALLEAVSPLMLPGGYVLGGVVGRRG